MIIVIYNINSFGGNYEYSKCIFEAYSKNPNVNFIKLLMPSNATIEGTNVLKVLHSDIPLSSNKFLRKFHFLYRSFVNPFRLYKHLKVHPASIVLFNDFDQTTALFWAPFFRLLKKKHCFAVMLHDPDRDDFFPIKYLSQVTMRYIMSFMDIAFYHGYLPEKKYYKGNFSKVKVPHGIYDNNQLDESFLQHLKERAGGDPIIGILGNIRPEKNYELIIDALTQLPNTKLLIAGIIANSSISVDHYKEYAAKRGVGEKIIWVTNYLPQSHFNAAIKACDVILLYYKPSFTSQSGVLNAIAPFKKKLVISDSKSSLKDCVVKYNLGEVVPADDIGSLVSSIQLLLSSENNFLSTNWERYIEDSSWDKHAAIAIEAYKKKRNEC